MNAVRNSALSLMAILCFGLLLVQPASAKGQHSLRIAPFRSAPQMGHFRQFRFDLANLQFNRRNRNNRYLMLDQGF